MDIMQVGRFLRRLVQANAGQASKLVAEEIRDQILVNTLSSAGFGSDPYKKNLGTATIKKKKKAGTYKGPNSTLRDADRSILRLKVTGPRKNSSTVDFRSTGKAPLFYAHHHGERPPAPYEPYIAARSIIPMYESSVPMHIHEVAARTLIPSNGLPKITIRNTQTGVSPDDWREEAPF
jgi:hypothetical protein